MSVLTVQQAFNFALEHHRAGRLAEAEALYRQILEEQPTHADGLHLLGVVAHQSGRHELAIDLIGQAIVLVPNSAQAYAHLAEAYLGRGSVAEAIASYHRSIQLRADDAQTHHNLANALRRAARSEEAILALETALRLKPDYAEAQNDLGIVFTELRRFEEATAAFRRALELRPGYPEACSNLGVVLAESGRVDEAIAACQESVRLNPNHADGYNNLGIALARTGRIEEAEVACRRAIALDPGQAEAHNNLGNVLRDSGRLGESFAAYERALQLKPDYPDARNNLGMALVRQGWPDRAMIQFRRALELNPEHADAHNHLGIALAEQGRLDEALAAYGRAMQLDPNCAEFHNNLGNVRKDRGQLDEALAAFRRALELQPQNAGAHSNLIHTLQFQTGAGADAIVAEERRWERQFGESAQLLRPSHANGRDPARRPRVGYLSADFRDHVIGRNVMPLLKHRSRESFETWCYAEVSRPDGLTQQARAAGDQWRETTGVTDAALAEMIRGDGVDILVDLAQHLAGNRLRTFVRRPAPVQVSFAGYPATTGLQAIEYRISDRWLESGAAAGGSKSGCSPGAASHSRIAREIGERPAIVPYVDKGYERIYLIDSFWCYDPCGMQIEVGALPAKENGHITFGSLNNFCKINEAVLQLWARVMARVKESRLVMLSGLGSHRQQAVEFLARKGIAPHRVEFVEPRARRAYLELYHRLDIVLDPFPYNGHTTSLDALWMGVPVVSLAGEVAVSRAGLSQLLNLGLPEWVAHAEDEYVEIAVRLAGDAPRLAEMRRALRSRMEGSVLMDASHFARGIEAAYREMWRRWCASDGQR